MNDTASHRRTRAAQVAAEFDIGGSVRDVKPHGEGLINDTFIVDIDGLAHQAILQRINSRVFPAPSLIMDNLRALNEHARRRAAHGAGTRIGLLLPDIYRAHDGRDFVIDTDGDYWRALHFIMNTTTHTQLHNRDQAREIGRALGEFHALVADLPTQRMHITLPGFHVTPNYLQQFDAALARHGVSDFDTQHCVEFVDARRAFAHTLEEAKHKAHLSMRITHGDPKLNNFLFDTQSDRVVSLIDLDTVQPGLIHYDIGDCLRSSCNRAGEAPADYAAVRFDTDAAQAILLGYSDAAREFLTPNDFDFMFDAIRLIPFELGLRFLTDHLEGDAYFKTQRRGENLQRARVQFALTQNIEDREAEIRGVINSLRG